MPLTVGVQQHTHMCIHRHPLKSGKLPLQPQCVEMLMKWANGVKREGKCVVDGCPKMKRCLLALARHLMVGQEEEEQQLNLIAHRTHWTLLHTDQLHQLLSKQSISLLAIKLLHKFEHRRDRVTVT